MRTGNVVPTTAQRNIETIVDLEREFVRRRSVTQRFADTIGKFAGTMAFVGLHIVFFTAWFVLNSKHVGWAGAFDRYPYILLGVLVSVESVLLSTFVLMMQNRMQQRADERAHLNLQIDLLAEREITKLLQIQRLLCERLEVSQALVDRELQEFKDVTPIQKLARGLQEELKRVG